jgi:hypothetical protein
MTHMGRGMNRLGLAFIVAAASVAVTQSTAVADPGGHQVRYTITTGQELPVSLSYLATEPANRAAFDANSSAYLRNERVSVAPGAPWVFETTMNDTSWAYVRASGAAHYNGTPNPHCEIAVDGQVVVQQDGEIDAFCALKPW